MLSNIIKQTYLSSLLIPPHLAVCFPHGCWWCWYSTVHCVRSRPQLNTERSCGVPTAEEGSRSDQQKWWPTAGLANTANAATTAEHRAPRSTRRSSRGGRRCLRVDPSYCPLTPKNACQGCLRRTQCRRELCTDAGCVGGRGAKHNTLSTAMSKLLLTAAALLAASTVATADSNVHVLVGAFR